MTDSAENDAPSVTVQWAHDADAREMRAFVAGWFAHAQNPKDTPFLVEEAWHAYRLVASATRVIPPAKTEGGR